MLTMFLVFHVVALSMVDQASKPLARPVRVSNGNILNIYPRKFEGLWTLSLFSSHQLFVQVWVLDATPGIVCPDGDGEDHPEELISVLSTLPNEVNTCSTVVPFFFYEVGRLQVLQSFYYLIICLQYVFLAPFYHHLSLHLQLLR